MLQYDCKIVYVKGEDNCAADALSRTSFEAEITASAPYPPDNCNTVGIILGSRLSAFKCTHVMTKPETLPPPTGAVAATLTISADGELLDTIRSGYADDSWCARLLRAAFLPHGVRKVDGLLYAGDRLIIPRKSTVRESLFHLAHNVLGHFGFMKSYGSLRDSFYWPNMQRDLELVYVPSCADCQRNKPTTKKPMGPLHPLPIPDQHGDSVAIDFIGPLPEDEGYNCIVTFTDRLNSDVRIMATWTNITAEELAVVFFDEWYCKNGIPLEIISDRDKLFMSKFWGALHKIMGIKLKMSSAYHPQSDGASEQSNKTINQCLRYHVERNQLGWKRALRCVHFDIMNTINGSTGFSPFQLRMGCSPQVIPPLIRSPEGEVEDIWAVDVIKRLQLDVREAQDNMLHAKISQALSVDVHRTNDFPFCKGGHVILSTLHRQRDYKAKGEKRVAKFMRWYNRPYMVTETAPDISMITVDMPNNPNTFPTFHTSQVLPFVENDKNLFPSQEQEHPDPVIIKGEEEYYVDRILEERKQGRGTQYLVRWQGYGPEEDRWLPGCELQDCEALDIWLARKESSCST